MNAYALGHLRPIADPAHPTPAAPQDHSDHPDVLAYLERIQDTLDPFGGRFVVHGGTVEVREGDWRGALVLIEFPDLDQARAWYDSAAYREILPLRTRHLTGDVLLAEGCGPDHSSRRMADDLRRAGAARAAGAPADSAPADGASRVA